MRKSKFNPIFIVLLIGFIFIITIISLDIFDSLAEKRIKKIYPEYANCIIDIEGSQRYNCDDCVLWFLPETLWEKKHFLKYIEKVGDFDHNQYLISEFNDFMNYSLESFVNLINMVDKCYRTSDKDICECGTFLNPKYGYLFCDD